MSSYPSLEDDEVERSVLRPTGVNVSLRSTSSYGDGSTPLINRSHKKPPPSPPLKPINKKLNAITSPVLKPTRKLSIPNNPNPNPNPNNPSDPDPNPNSSNSPKYNPILTSNRSPKHGPKPNPKPNGSPKLNPASSPNNSPRINPNPNPNPKNSPNRNLNPKSVFLCSPPAPLLDLNMGSDPPCELALNTTTSSSSSSQSSPLPSPRLSRSSSSNLRLIRMPPHTHNFTKSTSDLSQKTPYPNPNLSSSGTRILTRSLSERCKRSSLDPSAESEASKNLPGKNLNVDQHPNLHARASRTLTSCSNSSENLSGKNLNLRTDDSRILTRSNSLSSEETSQKNCCEEDSGMLTRSTGPTDDLLLKNLNLCGEDSGVFTRSGGLSQNLSQKRLHSNPKPNIHRKDSRILTRCFSDTSEKRIRSLDEATLDAIICAKKVSESEQKAQRKLKASEYGRKQSKVNRVVPEVEDLSGECSSSAEPQRCKFITAQSDLLYVTYHDEEWGVPVHDDKRLFELLVLSGAQVELNWSTILRQRNAYRDAFCGYDPITVASFTERHIQSLEADKNLKFPMGKVRGVVENAKCIVEVVKEFGSLDNYLWGFLNHKPMNNHYRYPKQVPVKTSKSESMSKDLVKRGFRFVGSTIVYSFMQASGMTNDHLLQCFRHQACSALAGNEATDSECIPILKDASPFSLEMHEDKHGDSNVDTPCNNTNPNNINTDMMLAGTDLDTTEDTMPDDTEQDRMNADSVFDSDPNNMNLEIVLNDTDSDGLNICPSSVNTGLDGCLVICKSGVES